MTIRYLFTFALWGICFLWPRCAALMKSGPSSAAWTSLAVEAAAILVALLLLARSQRVANLFGSLDLPRRMLALAMLGLLLHGQAACEGKRTYPFVAWGMYTETSPDSGYVEFLVEHESGLREIYPFHRLHPRASHIKSRFVGRGQAILKSAGDPEKSGRLRAKFADDLRELAAQYRRLYPERSLRAIVVNYCAVPIRDYGGFDSITRQTILRVDL